MNYSRVVKLICYRQIQGFQWRSFKTNVSVADDRSFYSLVINAPFVFLQQNEDRREHQIDAFVMILGTIDFTSHDGNNL